MVAELLAGVSGFKGVLDVLKSLKDMNDAGVRERVAVELRGQILSAYEEQTALLEEVRALKTKLAGFEKWEATSQQYELKQIGWGSFTLVLKPDTRGSNPPHWVCTHCFEDKRISVIQHGRVQKGDFEAWHCPACKTKVTPNKMGDTGEIVWPD